MLTIEINAISIVHLRARATYCAKSYNGRTRTQRALNRFVQ